MVFITLARTKGGELQHTELTPCASLDEARETMRAYAEAERDQLDPVLDYAVGEWDAYIRSDASEVMIDLHA